MRQEQILNANKLDTSNFITGAMATQNCLRFLEFLDEKKNHIQCSHVLQPLIQETLLLTYRYGAVSKICVC